MQAGEAIEEIIKAVEAVLAEGGLNHQQLTFIKVIRQNAEYFPKYADYPSNEAALRQAVSTVLSGLRTPLTVIQGYSMLLVEQPEQFGGVLSPKQQEAMRFVTRQAQAFGNWHSGLLASVHEERMRELKALPQSCDLAKILEHSEAVLQFYLQQGKRPVQLQFFIPENLPPIFAASYHLSQLIIHIIDVMATELIEYGKITVSAESDGTLVNLRIFCTGIGSSTAEIHSLFEKEGRHAYRKRFEQQGGRIEFSREAGLGAAVHLLIAIAKN
jgi:signal transduction histidine kinase